MVAVCFSANDTIKVQQAKEEWWDESNQPLNSALPPASFKWNFANLRPSLYSTTLIPLSHPHFPSLPLVLLELCHFSSSLTLECAYYKDELVSCLPPALSTFRYKCIHDSIEPMYCIYCYSYFTVPCTLPDFKGSAVHGGMLSCLVSIVQDGYTGGPYL